MTEWRPGDGIADAAREAAQRATALMTLALHGITIRPDRSVSIEDDTTAELMAIVNDLDAQELRELAYALTTLAVGALRSVETSLGPLLPLLAGFSAEEWLKQLGMNLTTAPRDPREGA